MVIGIYADGVITERARAFTILVIIRRIPLRVSSAHSYPRIICVRNIHIDDLLAPKRTNICTVTAGYTISKGNNDIGKKDKYYKRSFRSIRKMGHKYI
ncbi:MAG: hypothetical protein AB1480_11385 [Nitrospirota bacterium]